MATSQFEKLFDSTDADKDGTVARSDYERLVERVTKAYSLAADDPKAKGLRDVYDTFWKQLLLKAKAKAGDSLSKQQFVSALGLLTAEDGGIEAAIHPIAAALFKIALQDSDSDYLDRDGFARLLKATSGELPEHLVEDAIDRADSLGEGRIPRQDLLRSVSEFLSHPYSDEKPGAGALLLGALPW